MQRIIREREASLEWIIVGSHTQSIDQHAGASADQDQLGQKSWGGVPTISQPSEAFVALQRKIGQE